MHRYALYYAPAPGSALWEAGCRWLGRDAQAGRARAPLAPFAPPGVDAATFSGLTERARHYGFHATLKAPFRLQAGHSEADLLQALEEFAQAQPAVALPGLQVALLNNFLALRPAGSQEAVQALAQRCVHHFSAFRAPLTPAELDKRRSTRLSPRQEALLLRWGYPYTEAEFRFHMTLSGSLADLDPAASRALRQAAVDLFAPALQPGKVLVDALTLFAQAQPESPFRILQRFFLAAPVGAAHDRERRTPSAPDCAHSFGAPAGDAGQ